MRRWSRRGQGRWSQQVLTVSLSDIQSSSHLQLFLLLYPAKSVICWMFVAGHLFLVVPEQPELARLREAAPDMSGPY